MTQLKRSVIKVNGVKLFYRDSLIKSQPFLCLHGKWGRGETWSDFIWRYGNEYRIIAPDQRGHGFSDKPVARYAPQDMAEDAFGLITQLKCKPAIVMGHSMGGRNAAFLAALHPEAVKALIILDIGLATSKKISSLPPSEIEPIDELTFDWPTPYKTLNDAIKHLTSKYKRKSNSDYFLESLTETTEGYDFLFSRYSMAAIEEYLHDWTYILPKIKCPTLLVRAESSIDLTIEEAEIMRKGIENCKYVEVKNSDHMVYVDNPESFYLILDEFLSTIQ